MSDIRKLIGQAIIFTEIRVMLQAQSVFIGIYEGEYSPPKKISSFFGILAQNSPLLQKASGSSRGMHPYRHPQCTETGHFEVRNWRKKLHPPPHGSASTTSPSATAKSYKLL